MHEVVAADSCSAITVTYRDIAVNPVVSDVSAINSDSDGLPKEETKSSSQLQTVIAITNRVVTHTLYQTVSGMARIPISAHWASMKNNIQTDTVIISSKTMVSQLTQTVSSSTSIPTAVGTTDTLSLTGHVSRTM